MKTDIFQFCGHCWVFQICWHIECSTLTSSFRIWNSLARIPSPPLALFIVMFPKAHLTSHSRMFGSMWAITPSWFAGSLELFCIVLLCILAHHLNIFCFCSIPTISILYGAYLCMKCSLDISNFLEDIFSLSHSIVFPLFFCIVHLGSLSYLSLLFFGNLHSVWYIVPFPLCFSSFLRLGPQILKLGLNKLQFLLRNFMFLSG